MPTPRLADRIELRPAAALVPYARNARTHSARQVAQVAASIREFGFTNPVLVDEKGGIIAGHARVLAAVELGLDQVPTIELGYLSAAQRRAYVIADNQLALNAGWDMELLKLELGDLKLDGFDLPLTGFDEFDLAGILDKTQGLTGPDAVPAVPEHPVSRPGDLWLLGRHRLLCGDSTVLAEIARVLRDASIDMLLTDPPYSSGGQFRADRSKKTSTKYVQGDSKDTFRGEFTGDNRDQRAFLAWASMWAARFRERSKVGAVACIFTDWRQLPTLTDAMQCAGFVWRNLVTWWKPGIRMQRGRFSLSAEYVVYASNGVPAEGEKSPQNVLSFPPVDGKSKEHIAQKPVKLLEALMGVTHPGAIICDPFAGSGTTIIAAEMTGRACHAIEIAPAYVDVAVKRWQDFTGKTAVLDGDVLTFDEVTLQRSSENLASG